MKHTLEMRNIVKRFPGVLANDHVNLTIHAGEIHALARRKRRRQKHPDANSLRLSLHGFRRNSDRRRSRAPERPRDAIALGIGMVHQEFMLVRPFSVVENTVLGLREVPARLLDLREASEKLKELSDRHGLALDPSARVEIAAHRRAAARRDSKASLSRRANADPRRAHSRAHPAGKGQAFRRAAETSRRGPLHRVRHAQTQ